MLPLQQLCKLDFDIDFNINIGKYMNTIVSNMFKKTNLKKIWVENLSQIVTTYSSVTS